MLFALDGRPFDEEKVLERYELLYEAGLVEEARRDGRAAAQFWASRPLLGRTMQFDHRRIVATALGRLRGKLKYRPLVFELLPSVSPSPRCSRRWRRFPAITCTSRISAVGGIDGPRGGDRRADQYGRPPRRPVPLPSRGAGGTPGTGLARRRAHLSVSALEKPVRQGSPSVSPRLHSGT